MKTEAIYNLIADMKEDIGHIKGTAEATLEQVKKTNGRVTKSEADIRDLQDFQTTVKAQADQRGKMWATANAIITIVISLIGIAVTKLL